MANETELRKALEEALHALVTVDGAVATDGPDLFNFEAQRNAYRVQALGGSGKAFGCINKKGSS
jgi:hypothetical protein